MSLSQVGPTVAFVNSIHMHVQKGNDLLMLLMYQTKILPLCRMCNTRVYGRFAHKDDQLLVSAGRPAPTISPFSCVKHQYETAFGYLCFSHDDQ